MFFSCIVRKVILAQPIVLYCSEQHTEKHISSKMTPFVENAVVNSRHAGGMSCFQQALHRNNVSATWLSSPHRTISQRNPHAMKADHNSTEADVGVGGLSRAITTIRGILYRQEQGGTPQLQAPPAIFVQPLILQNRPMTQKICPDQQGEGPVSIYSHYLQVGLLGHHSSQPLDDTTLDHSTLTITSACIMFNLALAHHQRARKLSQANHLLAINLNKAQTMYQLTLQILTPLLASFNGASDEANSIPSSPLQTMLSCMRLMILNNLIALLSMRSTCECPGGAAERDCYHCDRSLDVDLLYRAALEDLYSGLREVISLRSNQPGMLLSEYDTQQMCLNLSYCRCTLVPMGAPAA